ncbi:hypothetical protein BJ165DRAFT_1534162 [Panaeolus papilionaceus]|nr:hypothetical protein BJ165DRAFT_1534162 [Panaeolus papilionaceus]
MPVLRSPNVSPTRRINLTRRESTNGGSRCSSNDIHSQQQPSVQTYHVSNDAESFTRLVWSKTAPTVPVQGGTTQGQGRSSSSSSSSYGRSYQLAPEIDNSRSSMSLSGDYHGGRLGGVSSSAHRAQDTTTSAGQHNIQQGHLEPAKLSANQPRSHGVNAVRDDDSNPFSDSRSTAHGSEPNRRTPQQSDLNSRVDH